MSELSNLTARAIRAYNSGNYQLSSLIRRQAAEIARGLGDTAGWAEQMQWAAEAEFSRGNYREAQRLVLLSVEAPNVTDPHVRWGRATLPYRIRLRYLPEKAVLLAMLEELEDQASRLLPAPQDMIMHRLLLHQETGDFNAAIEMGELAFLEYQSDGYGKEEIARSCVEVCVLAGRLDDAKSWLTALRRVSRESRSEETSAQYAAARLTLALAQKQNISALSSDLTGLEDAALEVDRFYVRWVLRTGRIRIALMDPMNGDPAKSWHPARKECRTPLPTPQNIHHRFEHHLLVLDYRLACVEFACRQDESVETPPDTAIAEPLPAIGQRIARARSALKVAFRRAQQLDGMLECDWRTRAVERRAVQLEELEARLVA